MATLERKSYEDVKSEILSRKKDFAASRDYDAVKKKIVNKKVDSDYLDRFVTDASSFFESVGSTFDRMSYKNAQSTYDSAKNKGDDLKTRAKTLNLWLGYNKKSLNEDSYKNISDMVSGVNNNVDDVLGTFAKKRHAITSYSTEEDYNSALEAYKKYESIVNYNFDKDEKEIEKLDTKAKNGREAESAFRNAYIAWKQEPSKMLSKDSTQGDDWYGESLAEDERRYWREETLKRNNATLEEAVAMDHELSELYSIYQSYGNIDEIESSLSEIKKQYNDIKAERASLLRAEEYFNVRNSADFEEYRTKGAHAADNELDAKASLEYKSEYDKYLSKLANSGTAHRDIFDYYWGKGEYDKARTYALDIADAFEYEYAKELFAEYDDNTLKEWGKNFLLGLDETLGNLGSAFSGNYVTNNDMPWLENGATSEDYLREMINADLREANKWGGSDVIGDLASTVGGMAPSIALSFIPGVGSALSTATFGISAGSGAFEQALNEGYTGKQALAYGVLVGSSEVLLEKLLGGITALGGGKLSGKVTEKLVGKIDDVFAKASFKGSSLINAFLKGTVDVGGKMASEALEESLQTVLEPWLKSITTGVDYDAPEWEEVAYSGLLGALSAGLLEGAAYPAVNGVAKGVVKGYTERSNYKALGEAVMSEIDNEALGGIFSQIGENISVDSKTGKKIKKASKTKSALDIGKAMVALDANLTDTQRSNLKGVLVDKGVAESDAEVITKWFSKVTEGETLNGMQEIALAENEVITEAVKDVVINEKTADSDIEFEWTGKNVIAKTDEEVEVVGISSIDNGKVYVELKDGKIVNADEINFGSRSDEVFYQAAKDMTVISATRMLEGFAESGMDPVDYLKGYREAYRYGRYGYAEDSAKKGEYAKALPAPALHTAYSFGVLDAKETISSKQKAAAWGKGKTKTDGKVVFLEDKDGKKIEAKGEHRKQAIKAAECLTKVTGNTVYFYESYVDEDGDRVYKNPLTGKITKNAPNGFITPQGDIYIDINAGMDGEGFALFTLGHEVSHFIRKFSPEKFKIFADVLVNEYAKSGYNVDDMVKQRMEEMLDSGELKESDGYEKNYDASYEEVVARACESMFRDSDVLEKVSRKLWGKDKKTWEKVKDTILSFIEKLKKAYASVTPQTEEAKMLLKMKKATEEVGKLWSEALMDAAENYGGVESEGEVKLSAREKQERYFNAPVNSEIVSLVEKVKSGIYKDNEIVDLGPVPDKIAKKIKKVVGIDVTGYKVVIEARQAKHIINRHGKSGKADSSMKNSEDIGKMQYTINSPDVLTDGGIAKGYSYFKDGKNRLAKTVLYEKSIGEKSYYVVEAVPETKSKTLYIVTAFIGEPRYKKREAPQLIDAKGPNETSKNAAAGTPINSISNNSSSVNSEKSHFTESQQFKRWFGDWQDSPETASKIVNADGTPKVLYHQTENVFTVFDVRHGGAGTRDNETPFGIFLKGSDRDIGLRGKRQMPLYAKIVNPLMAVSRDDLVRKISELSPEYAELREKADEIDREYSQKQKNAEAAFNNFILKNSQSENRKSRKELLEDEKFISLFDAEDNIVEEWEKVSKENDAEAKEVLTKVLKDNGYDGVILKNDIGSFGRHTEAYIVLDNTQVKSATDNVGTFDENNPDIRYSSRGKATVSKEFADKTLESFGITKLNDSIHVQRKVLSTLESEGFFTDIQTRSRTDVNEESGMVIETNKSGIDETFYRDNFNCLGKFKKIGKLATIRELPNIIKKGHVIADDVQSKYSASQQNKKFAYIESETILDGKNVIVKLAIKKSPQKNKFWVHSIYTIENVSDRPEGADSGGRVAGKEIADINGTISQDSSSVNSENSENKFSSRGMKGAVAEDRALVEESVRDREEVLKEALEKEMDDMRTLVELQREANAKKPSKNAISNIAGQLRTFARATKGDKAALEKEIGELYAFIGSSTPESLTWEAFTEKAKPIIDMLMADRTADVHVDERAESILKDLHSRKITLDDVQKAEVEKAYDKYSNYHKKTMGSFILTQTGGMELTSVWQELSEMYPEYFSADENSADMPLKLLDVIERLRKTRVSEDAGLTERMLSVELLQRIYEGYWKVTSIYTVSDVKLQKKISALNVKHKDQMNKVREARNLTIKRLENKQRDLKDRIKKREGDIINDYQEMLDMKLLRNKIAKLYESMYKKLTIPTKKNHVLDRYRSIVAELLASFSVDAAKVDAQLNGYRDENGVYHVGYRERIVWERNSEKKQKMESKIAELEKIEKRIENKLSALNTAYGKLAKNEEGNSQYEEVIHDLIKEAHEVVGNTPVGKMSLRQLRVVYELFRAVSYRINMEDKLFGSKKEETLSKTSENIQSEILANQVKPSDNVVLDKVRETKAYSSLKTGFNDTAYKMLNPIGVIETFGSKSLIEAFMDTRKGEDEWAVFMNDAIAYTKKMYDKYDYAEWLEADKKAGPLKFMVAYKQGTQGEQDPQGEQDLQGETEIPFTLEERMTIYALSQRQSAKEHLMCGGIVPTLKKPKKVKKDGKSETISGDKQKIYGVTEDMLLAVENSLTKEQKAFVADMVAFLSGPLAEKGNEATMKLYGIKLFTEEWYFPMDVASSTVQSKPGGDRAPTLKGWGATYAVNPEAKNPLVIGNFLDTWIKHVEGMANYYGCVVKVEDFTRIFNCKTQNGKTVKMVIADSYGAGAVKAIEHLINDANGGVKRESELAVTAKLLRNAKKAAVVMKLSVGIQQVSSITRAWQEMNPKYFVDLKRLVSVKGKLPRRAYNSLNADWEEAKKYAPIALVKEMGGFDVGSSGSVSELMKPQDFTKKAMEKIGGFPGFMDKVGWTSIWRAVRREIAAKYGVEEINNAFMEKHGQECADRFTEVIHKTQVYDSVFTRSELMRSKSTYAQLLTAFRGEPTKVLTMMWTTAIEARRLNAFDEKGKRRAFAKITRLAGVLVVTQAFNSALKALVNAGKDDDEDETWAENYIQAFSSDFSENVSIGGWLSLIPMVNEVVSLFNGYRLKRLEFGLLEDFVYALRAFESDSKTDVEKWGGLAFAIANLFGVPAENIYNDARYIVNTVETIFNNEKNTLMGTKEAFLSGWRGEETSDGELLYKAIVEGDEVYEERIRSRFETDAEVKSALVKALQNNDERISLASEAKAKGDYKEYSKIVDEMVKEGLFEKDVIVKAITSRKAVGNAVSIYHASDVNIAFENGDDVFAKEIISDIIQSKIADGSTEKEARSYIRGYMTSYWKPIYKESDKEEKTRIRKILLASGLYGRGGEVVKTCYEWEQEK